ncbi:MAG: ATP-grasp domain-containing protein [Atopobiaceae bacterium]|nr:ATP-grasp domain-containing protein [Atopobiaceae bacterium]
MEKLLIVGAGIGQMPILKKAKARGIHTTVVSIPGDWPCFEEADDVILCDIYDREGVVREAAKRRITAVTSDQNDLMNPTVAYVAERLGLPGNSFEAVMTYCNKNSFRDLCDRTGVPSPRHIAVSAKEIGTVKLDAPLPWIVKPADSQSSIGVCRIESEDELDDALRVAVAKSPTGTAILEEFFVGTEYVCEGFIDDGVYHLLQFADRKYFDLGGLLIPSQTVFPSLLAEEYRNRIVSYESALAREVRPAFAIVHSEYLVNERTGEIRVVESALRGGGVYISSHLIPLSTGIDANDLLLDKVLGLPTNTVEVFAGREDRAAGYICFYLSEGTITKVSGVEDLKAMPSVHMICLDGIEVGAKTARPTYKGARKGPILVSAESRQELDKEIQRVQDTLKIETVDASGFVSAEHWA